jgi:hypothetical protein
MVPLRLPERREAFLREDQAFDNARRLLQQPAGTLVVRLVENESHFRFLRISPTASVGQAISSRRTP